MFLYHITTAREWVEAQPKGVYLPEGFAHDGFIHCSFKDQVIVVANSYYKNMDHLALLKIDPDLVKARIIEENLDGGDENFPHIYGPLPVTAVIQVADLQKNENGYFTFPSQLG